MAETVNINLQHVARGIGIPASQVQAVVELLDEGNTVPFITRYRKDQTGGLDEEQIRQIQARLAKLRMLADRKQTILRSIEAQGKLTEALRKKILSANSTKRLEDLYLPFKPKKQTLATTARQRGLDPLAQEILRAADECADLDARATDYVNTDLQVPTAADALLGAGHILAEQFSERAEVRQQLREILQRTGKLVSTQIAPESKPAPEPSAPPSPPAPAEEKPAEEKPVEEKPGDRKPAEEKPAESKVADPPVESPAADTPQEPSTPEPEASPVASDDPPAEAKAEETAEPSAAVPAAPSEAREAENPSASSSEPPPAPEPSTEAAPAPEEKPSAKAPESKAAKRPAAPKLTKAQLRKKQAREKKLKAFSDYFSYSEEVKKIPPHRVLALNRGERAKVLRVKLEYDAAAVEKALEELLVPAEHPHAAFLRGCAQDAFSRLIFPSLERELRRELTDRAEAHAIDVFAKNLRNLLLQPPIHGRRVLAVDPGFKSGCKLVALDQFGNHLAHDVIYVIGKKDRLQRARRKVVDLINRFQLSVVAVGNGTACRETEDFFAALIEEEYKDGDVAYVIVNEAGASVYSTSRLGREEFPHYDATLRGAISIGRRLQDPLSELVKIDPANIGVGLYQHDVKAKHLRASLDEVVESCVNYVGVDVNMASPALLRYVSGMNQLTARRVYEYRLQHGPFRNRQQFKDVPGLGVATFIQAAGFLKIPNGDQPLDATWIHPESYEMATRTLERLESRPEVLSDNEASAPLAERLGRLDVGTMAKEFGVGELLLKDIVAQLARPGRDPREDLPAPIFKHGVLKLEDLTPGMELTGTVLNVVDFGAFVDIGMHDSGLVHVSHLANKFVRDPYDVVAVGDIVKVWVVGVDKERRRVSLTMVAPGTERPAPRRGEKGEGRSGPPRGKRASEDKRPRGKKPFRAKDKRPPKPKYKPRSRPKPVVPITEGMKSGSEAMRTFGDLAQFFQYKQEQLINEKKGKAKDADDKKQEGGSNETK